MGLSVDSHSALKNMFGLRFVETGKIDKKFRHWLNKLNDKRDNGDYKIFTSFDIEDARVDLQEAEEFLEEMKKYFSQNHGVEF